MTESKERELTPRRQRCSVQCMNHSRSEQINMVLACRDCLWTLTKRLLLHKLNLRPHSYTFVQTATVNHTPCMDTVECLDYGQSSQIQRPIKLRNLFIFHQTNYLGHCHRGRSSLCSALCVTANCTAPHCEWSSVLVLGVRIMTWTLPKTGAVCEKACH